MSELLIVEENGRVRRAEPRPRLRGMLLALAILILWSTYAAGFYSRRVAEISGVAIPDPDFPVREVVDLVQRSLVPATPVSFSSAPLVFSGSNTVLTIYDGSDRRLETATVTVRADGTVKIRDGVTLDSAALAFWTAVGHISHQLGDAVECD